MKRCARGWSLIPRAPRSRQRFASSIGLSVRSRRTNGISRPSERSCVLERAVVRRAKRRMPVRLVHAEHERPGHAVALHAALELFVDPAHPVDVVPQMDVRVEDLGAVGEQASELLVVARDQLLGPLELLAPRTLSLGSPVRILRSARRPDLRRHRDAARDAARGSRCRAGSVPVRRKGRQENDVLDRVRGRADHRGRIEAQPYEEFGYDELLAEGKAPASTSSRATSR